MIVAVESNFVLELAFRQQEANACDRLIELAAERAIQLVIPACALFEPFETLIRREKERDGVLQKLDRELEELSRSAFFCDLAEKAELITKPMADSDDVFSDSLVRTIGSILRVASVVPLSSSVMSHAMALHDAYPLSPQDAVVVASVDLYMRKQRDGLKLFANRNIRDFMKPGVKTHFEQYGCRIVGSFAAALQFMEATPS